MKCENKEKVEPVNYGTRETFADIAATVLDYLDIGQKVSGTRLYAAK